MAERWRLLPLGHATSADYLATAEALLVAPQPTLALHIPSDNALILGAGQPVTDVSGAAVQVAGITVLKRRSGGAAVLAAPDQLWFTIALPPAHSLAVPDVTEAYRWLGAAWVVALADYDPAAHMVTIAEARADLARVRAASPDDPQRMVERACFGTLSPYEVAHGTAKLVGLAQIRRRAGTLFQGSLHMGWRPADLVRMLAVPEVARAGLVAALAARAIGLADVQPQHDDPATLPALAAAFVASLQRLYPIEMAAGALSADEAVHKADALRLFRSLL